MITVINRHKDASIKTDIITQSGEFAGALEVYEVNGPDIKSENDFGKTTVKTLKKSDLKARGSSVTYDFPPHSITLLKAQLK
ncbi:MAG: hypothetical protein LC643_02010 [Bacteroidales bacterium]|nr:hypothetical protein [Bacteroidales bacterium]